LASDEGVLLTWRYCYSRR